MALQGGGGDQEQGPGGEGLRLRGRDRVHKLNPELGHSSVKHPGFRNGAKHPVVKTKPAGSTGELVISQPRDIGRFYKLFGSGPSADTDSTVARSNLQDPGLAQPTEDGHGGLIPGPEVFRGRPETEEAMGATQAELGAAQGTVRGGGAEQGAGAGGGAERGAGKPRGGGHPRPRRRPGRGQGQQQRT